MDEVIKAFFSVSEDIRYVAIYSEGKLTSLSRENLSGSSSSESDKYEELIVNPVLLKLVIQRGNIDCGGAHYILIRYGNFYEYVKPVKSGHLSVGIELSCDVYSLLPLLDSVAENFKL